MVAMNPVHVPSCPHGLQATALFDTAPRSTATKGRQLPGTGAGNPPLLGPIDQPQTTYSLEKDGGRSRLALESLCRCLYDLKLPRG